MSVYIKLLTPISAPFGLDITTTGTTASVEVRYGRPDNLDKIYVYVGKPGTGQRCALDPAMKPYICEVTGLSPLTQYLFGAFACFTESRGCGRTEKLASTILDGM